MTQKLRYSVLALILIGWIRLFTNQGSTPKPGIHPDIKPYINKFIELGKRERGANFTMPEIDIDIGVANDLTDQFLAGGVLGWCKRWLSPKQIILDEDYWQESGTWDREQLIFHELGHCALDREHDDTKLQNGWPRSIMYSTNEIDERKYLEWYEYYIKELFAGRP